VTRRSKCARPGGRGELRGGDGPRPHAPAIAKWPASLWRSTALLAAVASGGCSLGAGSFAAPMTSGSVVDVAQKVDARLHISESNGAFFGAEEVVATEAGETCCSQWRALVTAGYADIPSVSRSMVGLDALVLGGGGRMPPRTGPVSGGWMAGAQLALPLRLNPPRELWQSDDYLGTAWQLVPDVTALTFFPSEGRDKRVNLELAVGLSFRVFITSKVLP
jgi:hypothetical protein